MPDSYDFHDLGDSVRCIDCPRHGIALKDSTTDLRRRRPLLAAPPATNNEEKEATMATKAPGKGEPAKQVAIDILRKAREPLHAKEIAKRVLASGRCAGLKGKTPEATISAMLAVGSKPGGPFTRVDKGTYALAGTKANQSPSKAARSRKAPAKRTSQTRTRTSSTAKPTR